MGSCAELQLTRAMSLLVSLVTVTACCCVPFFFIAHVAIVRSGNVFHAVYRHFAASSSVPERLTLFGTNSGPLAQAQARTWHFITAGSESECVTVLSLRLDLSVVFAAFCALLTWIMFCVWYLTTNP